MSLKCSALAGEKHRPPPAQLTRQPGERKLEFGQPALKTTQLTRLSSLALHDWPGPLAAEYVVAKAALCWPVPEATPEAVTLTISGTVAAAALHVSLVVHTVSPPSPHVSWQGGLAG